LFKWKEKKKKTFFFKKSN